MGNPFFTLLLYAVASLNSIDRAPVNHRPRVSVVMSVFNNAAFLPAAIESILAQSFTDFEFLILNDGSTDSSQAVIDRFAAADPRIRPLHQDNRGLVASLNRLVKEARAPLLARMDGDDIALPERFERQLAFLAAHPDHGAVGTWAQDIDEQGRPRASAGRDQPTSHAALLDQLEEGQLLCHPSVMMDRDLVLRVGGYRAAYPHCEDYDLWLRLSEHTLLCSIPERLLLYRHSDRQVSTQHVLAQQLGAAIAFAAHCERIAGRPDPTDGLSAPPPLDQLDALFDRPGLGRAIRARVAPRIVYSATALDGEGYGMLLDHLREGGARQGLWRTAARLVKMGQPARALRLAAALARR